MSRCSPCSLVALRTTKASTGDRLLRDRGVQDRVGHRVRAQGEAADGLVVPVGGEHPQEPADQGRRLVLQRDPPQVDVVVGLGARGQRDPLVHHGELPDQGGEPLPRGVVVDHRRFRSDRSGDPSEQRSGQHVHDGDDRLVLAARHGHDLPPGQVGQALVDDPACVEPQRARARAGVDPGPGVELRADEAGAQRDGAHPGAVQRRRDSLGEGRDPGLVGTVGRTAAGEEAGQAGHVDHSAAAPRDHAGQRRAGQVEDRRDVDVELGPQRLGRGVQETRADREPGAVHQHVDGAGALVVGTGGGLCLAETGRDALAALDAGQVGRQHLHGHPRAAVAGRGGVEAVPVACDEHQVAAVGGEPCGEGGADSGGGSGDQGSGHAATVTSGPGRVAGAGVTDPVGAARSGPAPARWPPRRDRPAGPGAGPGWRRRGPRRAPRSPPPRGARCRCPRRRSRRPAGS